MPWDESYYPRSIRKLPSEVRLKAIEIANALLEEGYAEGKAMRIAIAKAKEWARDASRVETVGLAVRREAAYLRVCHPRVSQR